MVMKDFNKYERPLPSHEVQKQQTYDRLLKNVFSTLGAFIGAGCVVYITMYIFNWGAL